MELNWYVICTKLKEEKKAVALLSKNGIENYCPFTNVERTMGAKKILENQPLFCRNVFVYITENEMRFLKSIPCVINMAFWLSKPAIINPKEINIIREITEKFTIIKLRKTAINLKEDVRIIVDNSAALIDNNHVSIERGLIITLPSLGYEMMTRFNNANEIFTPMQLPKQGMLPKILNTGFFFGL